MSDSDKRSALDELYAAVQTLTFLHHVEHHSGEGGSWWKQDCCSGHHEMILRAGEELRALRAEVERLRKIDMDLVAEAQTVRFEAEAQAEENAAMRELLIDVFDLWDDNAIEHSTPDNYVRVANVFNRILAVLPPERQAAILGRREP